MDLSPEILDAMRCRYEAMGFGFNPEGLSRYRTNFTSSMGLPPQEIANLLIQKITASRIKHDLPKCVQKLGNGTLISMPLEDLSFAYGYLALVEAGSTISLNQTKRAIQIAHNFDSMETGAKNELEN